MIRAVLLDAAGTLISVVEPVGETYARLAAPFGVTRPPQEIGRRFKAAMRAPWPGPRQRGDGRRFWSWVVAEATGSADPALFEAAYAHFARAEAWRVNPGVVEALTALRARGIKLAALSNWDTRLPGTLANIGLSAQLDRVVCSGALGIEKPHRAAFWVTCGLLGVLPHEALHVGDDPDADAAGAKDAGLHVALLGRDLGGFDGLPGLLDPLEARDQLDMAGLGEEVHAP
ncbi:HAD-IA family hydrolase [Myxococcota bacterium]|nr:HAD-IA family hydrolase [Myxococcota bacterium]